MPITQEQVRLIRVGHAQGLRDAAVAKYAGVGLATVKRYRKKLGLPTTFIPYLRGKEGERIVFRLARQRGLSAYWALRHDEKYDLVINGCRVDAKTSMRCPDGAWRFSLPHTRNSFYGEYAYFKDYAADCEYLVLITLYPDDRDPDVYFIDSTHIPLNIVLRRGGLYEFFRNDWTALEGPVASAA